MKSWAFRACSATAALVLAGVLSIGLQLVASAAPAGASVTPCGTAPYASNSIITVHCYAPDVTTLQSGTASCPGSSEWFSRDDYAGVPIGWTYTALGNVDPCISVDWVFSALPSNCQFSFYVPDGFATGTIWFTEDNGNGTPGNEFINEDPVTGWQSLPMLPGTFWLESLDAHDYTSLAELGWGSSPQYSLMAICPKV